LYYFDPLPKKRVAERSGKQTMPEVI